MNNLRIFTLLTFLGLANVALSQSLLVGTWQGKDATGNTITMICSEKYLFAGTFSPDKFIKAVGGTYQLTPSKDKQVLVFKQAFNTVDSTKAGLEIANYASLKPTGELVIEKGPLAGTWKQVEKMNKNKEEGTWLLKAQEGADGRLKPWLSGAMKKVRLVTATHFFWAGFNDETKQILGISGGTYTIKGGKLSEKIDFSYHTPDLRGMQLVLDYVHKEAVGTMVGVNSKGKRVHEVWEKQD